MQWPKSCNYLVVIGSKGTFYSIHEILSVLLHKAAPFLELTDIEDTVKDWFETSPVSDINISNSE